MSFKLGDIIDDVLRREGGAASTNRKNDRGGRTQYGISEKSNPEAWKDGKVTEDEARAIYIAKYVTAPGFDKITDVRLQHQLVDFGVLSGPRVATQKLQEILGVPPDGMLGPITFAAIAARSARELNNLLVVQRVKLIGRICKNDSRQLENLNGWLNRALDFLIP